MTGKNAYPALSNFLFHAGVYHPIRQLQKLPRAKRSLSDVPGTPGKRRMIAGTPRILFSALVVPHFRVDTDFATTGKGFIYSCAMLDCSGIGETLNTVIISLKPYRKPELKKHD